jgi:hypothetical protein
LIQKLNDAANLILAVTNHPGILLDTALYRRFYDVLHYSILNNNHIEPHDLIRLVNERLTVYKKAVI